MKKAKKKKKEERKKKIKKDKKRYQEPRFVINLPNNKSSRRQVDWREGGELRLG